MGKMASSFAPKCANGMARPLGFVCSGQVGWGNMVVVEINPPLCPLSFPGTVAHKKAVFAANI